MRRVIKVRWQVVGFHHWPTPSDHRVYLGRDHRHVFHCQVEAVVSGENREVEFHDLLEEGQRALANAYYLRPGEGVVAYEFGIASCEMIAREILGGTVGACAAEVWEDGECGARVEVGG